jgi:hypothetical protein
MRHFIKYYLEKELVIGIDRKNELRMLQTPKANMFMLASIGFPPAVDIKKSKYVKRVKV